MSNIDRPRGFKPVGHLNGNPWNGKANMYYVPVGDSTAIFIGDAVQSAGSADATGKYPTVKQAAVGANAIRGVAIGFSDQPFIAVDTSNLYRMYRPASTAMYVLVVDDPDVIFEIQEDNASSDLAATDVGSTTDIVVGSGDTSNGMSGMELNSDSAGTSSDQCLLLRVSNREDNALGDHCKWDVLITYHELSSAVAGTST